MIEVDAMVANPDNVEVRELVARGGELAQLRIGHLGSVSGCVQWGGRAD